MSAAFGPSGFTEKGVNAEFEFFRQLQPVTTRIHDTENIEQIMVDASADICRRFQRRPPDALCCQRRPHSPRRQGQNRINTTKALKLPVGVQCIAGYVAMSRQSVNIADVYDSAALQQVHPQLSFLNEVDKRSGYRTKQLLVVPVMAGDVLHGVLQVINSHSDHAFGSLEEDGARQLSHTRGIAMRQRMQRAEEQQRKKLTRYDGLVLQGVLTQDELTACIQKARDQAVSVKHLLMADFHIRPAQIGPALARFFGVAYELFNAVRIRSEVLHGALKRDFVESQG